MSTYLLDTDVISELMAAPSRKRRQAIEAWLRSLADESVVVSTVSIAEITRAIKLSQSRNAAAAAKLELALHSLLKLYGDTILTPSHAEWQAVAELSAAPGLRHLFFGKNDKNQPRTGADAYLAVQANAIAAAIATLNSKDFTLIDQFMPIEGGIINPASSI